MFAGSSPLTRGTRIDSGQNDRFNRFIPAYAGNSCSNAPVSATIPVHPRLRGELTSRGLPFMVVIGSSPLTRGTLAFDDASYSAARSIPAYAGNSAQGKARNLLRSVHPRLRGELVKIQALTNFTAGSSPLTRGTQFFRRSVCVIDRFIPAYAGNSNDHFRPLRNFEVHPRLRGELRIFLPRSFIAVGSSPLTRGTRERRRSYQLCCSVHPRLRGELPAPIRQTSKHLGSSPLTRGTLTTRMRPER